jgi:hypothetical protein
MHRLLVVLALSACVPTSYTFSSTSRGEVPRQPGPKGCEFTVHQSPPEEGFEEVGTLKHYNGDLPQKEADFKKAIATRVCEVGGHAVIAQRTSKGYESATVIKYSKGFHL